MPDVIERVHLEAAEGVDPSTVPGFDSATYVPPSIEAQWQIAYKLHTDDDGVYGMPHPVPIGELTGGSRLLSLRRIDGGPAWSVERPARVAPKGTIECVSERCGDAHIGGKRKMLTSLEKLIRHVETFHPEDFATYRKYFDQIADQIALNNPRLMALMNLAGVKGAEAVVTQQADLIFYCDDDDCTESFNTQKKKDTHMKVHKGDT